ncbi:TetR/AcrR family transcriptional regulator [Mycobacterium sp. 1274761.0]|uniref:TetR/AcrR family transcriptional regulator n=1 Tax=Mycobacterium sp. 1274761.0 TaxID=1834077 RepID=UPI000AFCAA71|nr:TetR/AcrR family transcriptional regulator [Mycobacterium sp. 1274761.0]
MNGRFIVDEKPAETPARNRPGRPRSEASRAAVLRATSQLLRDVGLRAMTTEQIAGRSGASKATIYKWWPNKYAVAIEAFLTEMMAESHDPDTGSARDDLATVMHGLLRFYTGPSGRVFAQLVGEAQADPAILQELRIHLVDSRRELFRTIWDRGVDRGEFRGDLDSDAVIDLLIGPALYRLLVGHAPLTGREADTLVDATLRVLAERE